MTNLFPTSVTLDQPHWLHAEELGKQPPLLDEAGQMRRVLELTRRNIEEKTGGPFGAAVFDRDSGQLISAAVNRVQPLHNSTAHAEMIALMLAQKRMGSARLDEKGKACVLVTSAQPCSMCFGALPWAGIRRLVIGARREEVESIAGFDEGPMPEKWPEALRARGIEVRQDVLREEAVEALRLYAESGGDPY
ncbi:MAG: nucleoside deaminase [Verrucomicrobia bacterium]|jgi:tRNA(Arg) A34 adenosine deaminase TadA|nr:nucleoside deaminase [Verrucomicrobiota bacterium]